MIKKSAGWMAYVFAVMCIMPLCAVKPFAAELPPPVRPNVLLIAVDDAGLGDISVFSPAAAVHTPNIDALAARGMRFTRFYTDSTCSASRAALLTGQHPARLGFHPVARGIAPEVLTLAEWFQQQGYSTHHIGKWHAGELYDAAKPAAQGFDTSFGYLNQWMLQGPDANGERVLRPPVYENPWLETGRGDWQQYSGYLPDILNRAAEEKINELAMQKTPWLLFYATPLVHGPLHAPPNGSADANSSDDEKYRAMLTHLDGNIGELLTVLEQSGQRDNTIMVLLSDNGAPEKREGSNGSWAGGKSAYNEGGVRTPMIWVDPARHLPNSLDARAISIMDVFPTLAARIGAPLPFKTDGVDFDSLVAIAPMNERSFYWLSRGSYSVLSADKSWRLEESWVFREWQSVQWLQIAVDHVRDLTAWRVFYLRNIATLRESFRSWLDTVVSIDLQVRPLQGAAAVVRGNDFLRTPLKEWDFYVALVAKQDGRADQFIAEQRGVWSLVYQPAAGQLRMQMHGHEWLIPVDLEGGCHLLGLNADIYDRYTNLSPTINPTELLLSLDGREVARTQWKIDSLLHVNIAEPLWLGVSAAQDAAWQGQLSAPVMYHWASRIGEWPFFVDENKLRSQLCSQLH